MYCKYLYINSKNCHSLNYKFKNNSLKIFKLLKIFTTKKNKYRINYKIILIIAN